jgi:tRNA(fMet)-specific endonuclease VapC
MPKPGDILLDTNAAIALLNRNPGIEKFLTLDTEIFLPLTALGELFFGVDASSRKEANLQSLERLCLAIPVLLPDADTARAYGHVRSQLKRDGSPIPQNDIWIAAAARQHGLVP